MDLRKQKAFLKDLAAINRIMRASKGYWGYTQSFMDKFMAKFSVTEKCVKESYIYCAYINHEMLGFYKFKKSENDQDELDLFFLDPIYIGKGFGRQLWNLCLDTAKELKIESFVLSSDPNSEKFYLKMGCYKIRSVPSPICANREIPILQYSLKADSSI